MIKILVFVWNRTLRERVNFYFFRDFLLVLAKFSFWGGSLGLGYNSMKFWDFANISWFPKILSLQPFGNSYISCLLLIITLRFSCGQTPRSLKTRPWFWDRPRFYSWPLFINDIIIFIEKTDICNCVDDNTLYKSSPSQSVVQQFRAWHFDCLKLF